MKQQTAVIIGAGPAGLTAAIELQRRAGIKPILIETTHEIGGLSRTIVYKGNRMDIGGHRFFSKSDRVMRWWLSLMPTEGDPSGDRELRYKSQDSYVTGTDNGTVPHTEDFVMLVRQRKSRIYFLRLFFDYPVRLTLDTLKKMGLIRSLLVCLSFLRSSLLPRREERSLEDFLINRFGKKLYLLFFKSYTEKVWGVPCHEISAEWGAQRIKTLSLKGVVAHFVRKAFHIRQSEDGIAQRNTETSLIEHFLYPKLGPGQLWEHAADLAIENGGEIHFDTHIDRVNIDGNRVISVEGRNELGDRATYSGDYFFSTMPVGDLIRALSVHVPAEVTEVSEGLLHRDFITVGLLAKKLLVTEEDGGAVKDNWIYVQEPDVLVGRLQIFNNWSPSLVGSKDKVWIGLEYFCNDTDPIWKLSDDEIASFAIAEAAKLSIVNAADIEDAHVVRVPKTYPAYFGSYNRFELVRNYIDRIENLFLIGRNGMHKYNNQDHSMLTAMTAVDNIVNGITAKDNIWAVNTEMEYHEEKAPS